MELTTEIMAGLNNGDPAAVALAGREYEAFVRKVQDAPVETKELADKLTRNLGLVSVFLTTRRLEADGVIDPAQTLAILVHSVVYQTLEQQALDRLGL